MTRILTGIAALMIVGAAALPVPASAVEQGITKAQLTDLSSRHRWHRHHYWRHHHGYYRHWGPRRYYGYHRYWGPRYRYGYYPYRYRHYGYYGYHRPGLALGVGPLGVRVF